MLHFFKSAQFYILLVLALVTVVIIWTRPVKEATLQEAIPPVIQAAPVELRALYPEEIVSGRLEPVRRTTMSFELAGSVETRNVEPGQRVERGAVLMQLDTGDYGDALAEEQARLNLEEQNIARDQKQLELARKNRELQRAEVERLQKLGKDSLISLSRLDETRRGLLQLESEETRLQTSVDTAGSRLDLRRAARDRAARNLERTRLKAPYPGTVNEVHVQVGDYVTPNQAAIDLVDTSSLDLYLEVRGEVVKSLALAQEIPVFAGDRQLTGRIVALQIDPDPATFTHALRVRVPAGEARAGEPAQARLLLRPLEGVATVPVTAVLREEGKTYVFRVVEDTLVRTEVRLGQRVDEVQVVLSGVEPGDQVVSRDVAALSDGQKVTVRPDDVRAQNIPVSGYTPPAAGPGSGMDSRCT